MPPILDTMGFSTVSLTSCRGTHRLMAITAVTLFASTLLWGVGVAQWVLNGDQRVLLFSFLCMLPVGTLTLLISQIVIQAAWSDERGHHRMTATQREGFRWFVRCLFSGLVLIQSVIGAVAAWNWTHFVSSPMLLAIAFLLLTGSLFVLMFQTETMAKRLLTFSRTHVQPQPDRHRLFSWACDSHPQAPSRHIHAHSASAALIHKLLTETPWKTPLLLSGELAKRAKGNTNSVGLTVFEPEWIWQEPKLHVRHPFPQTLVVTQHVEHTLIDLMAVLGVLKADVLLASSDGRVQSRIASLFDLSAEWSSPLSGHTQLALTKHLAGPKTP